MEDVINYLRKVRRGTMFIIEGPSGTGKGTVIKEILARDPHIKFSVSVTTRPPRKGEVNGVDYYFISDEEYDRLKTEDAFYEYVDSQYGSRYGTLRSEVDSFINVGEDVLFDLDWMGARQMKEKAGADAVTIYLLPPSIREVRRRLEGRGTDSREVIEKRMDLVLEKISHWNEFDYVVVNEELEDTVEKIRRIISGERMKRVRQLNGLKTVVDALVKEAEEMKAE
ncbi:MAG: guanylate kinase [Alphaproteobacteria bacterium]|jgi:guanylate kinase|nr:MAG: guanylate kinase [Azospirillum sp. 51_20]